ncbi:DNA cytosine methyltransferase [Xanthomonas oryzae]|uniref:DNA cytosine methyltransferase n=1 Tax=Xanthomonas oryzae TaxID=347 RepID=UPI00349F03D2
MTDPNHKKFRVAAFFAGAGGLDLGFDEAGFEIAYATDIDKQCVETLRANCGTGLRSHPHVECRDIRTLRAEDLPKDIDFVIGGPPCQSFSASGRRAGGAAGTLDLRGELFEAYCRVLTWLQPRGFLFENVRGILATNGGRDWERIRDAFSELGYTISYRVLDALDYGAPQQRERLFLVGHRADRSFLFPEPLFGPDSFTQLPHQTAGKALADLKNTEDLEPLVLTEGKYAHLLPLVPAGSNYLHFTAKRGHPNPVFAYRSRFSDFLYKASPTLPVKTIIASPGKYTGPFHWENRSFTIAEYKRLQGFPDDYLITGSRTEAIKQIGNSVSPKIARVLGDAIACQLFDQPREVRFLSSSATLTFDRRKGQKAQDTRKLHAELERNERPNAAFSLTSYESLVGPSTLPNKKNNVRVVFESNEVDICVKADPSRRIFCKMKLRMPQALPPKRSGGRSRDLLINVTVYGESEHAVQTIWNAVDDWVIRSSNFHSLIELYGHFTEPHPIFEIDDFKVYSTLPIAQFAKHCANFSNCSKHIKREHLLELFGIPFRQKKFLDLVETLRRYRFDIRCFETNIAMPKEMYMVAYPFTLPARKQMNFSVTRERGNEASRRSNPTNLMTTNDDKPTIAA